MATKRQQIIAETMTALGNRKFTTLEISVMEKCRKLESSDRLEKSIKVNTRTKEGKELINKRTADIANTVLNPKIPLKGEDIRLYKRCWADEYTNRTGKCIWGYKNTRERLGYDVKTGLEV